LESLLNICICQRAFFKKGFLDIWYTFSSSSLETWSGGFIQILRRVSTYILYVIHKTARSIHKTRLPHSSTVSVGESATGCLFASVNFIPLGGLLKWKLERKGKECIQAYLLFLLFHYLTWNIGLKTVVFIILCTFLKWL